MKTKISLSVLALGFVISAFSQRATMELTFTAVDNEQNVPLTSIFIENLILGGDTTLFAPDTVLVIDYITSIEYNKYINENSFLFSQNRPNPFKEKTEVILNVPKKEHIKMTVRDILGRELAQYENTLNSGSHSFVFYSGIEEYYLLSVTGNKTSKTIKMLNSNTSYAGMCKIVYNGYTDSKDGFKSQKEVNNFVFHFGDELKYTCYSENGERTIIDSPKGNQTYTFQYTGTPCPGMTTITDIDGNTYNTVQIGSQCWMAENLKTTTYNNGVPIPKVTNNDEWSNLTTGALAWFNNDIFWNDSYGALYNWYTTIDANGLCPTGWHIPANDEWTVLTNFIGGTVSPHGNQLKSCRKVNSPLEGGCNTSEPPRWDEHNMHYGTDDYGFSGLPGGYRYLDGLFKNIGGDGLWWSSTEVSSSTAWDRDLDYDRGFVGKGDYPKRAGFSIRCVRD